MISCPANNFLCFCKDKKKHKCVKLDNLNMQNKPSGSTWVTHFALSISHHRYSLEISLCIITHVLQVPGNQNIEIQRLVKLAHVRFSFSQMKLKLNLRTLSNSFILLRDITILLSSPSCFLNSPRASSSYTTILKEADSLRTR